MTAGIPVRATAFEFRHRFWLIALCFTLGFAAYRFDPVNAGVAILEALRIPTSRGALHLVFAAGATIATLGAALRTWASAYLSGAVVHDTALHDERLVADGPYRFVRNPLYLGLLLLAAGQSTIVSRLGALVLLAALGLLILRLIGREEAELESRQGDSFRSFVRRVPRLLPAMRPRLAPSGERPRWREGLLTEAFVWILTGATWLFAATLDLRRFGLACAVGCALYWPVARLQKKRAAALS